MSTRVSVLMTVRNGRPYIKDAIASVMNQTLSFDVFRSGGSGNPSGGDRRMT